MCFGRLNMTRPWKHKLLEQLTWPPHLQTSIGRCSICFFTQESFRIIGGHLKDQNSRTSRSNKVVKWSSHKVSQSQHHEVTKIVTLLQVQVCDASQSWHSHAATPAIETTPTIWLHPASQTNQQNNLVPWGVQSCLLICKYMYWHVVAYV